MKNAPKKPASEGAGQAPRAFTLVEILISMTIGMLVMAAVATVLVMSVKLANKNQQIATAVINTRLVQEHMNSEMAKAISQSTPTIPAPNRPTFSNPNGATAPIRYATMTYRVPVGSYGTLTSNAALTAQHLSVSILADTDVEIGDYLMMDAPNFGPLGLRITDRNPAAGSGTVDFTVASTLGAQATLAGDTTSTQATSGALVRFQREREYETVAPSPTTNPVTELHWYENTIDVGATPAKYVVLSTRVDANARYLFAQVPLDPGGTPYVYASEPSVSWQFTYLAAGSEVLGQGGTAKNKDFYQGNFVQGLIMPKSGNPLSAASYMGGPPTTLGTSTTNVSSTTTLATTTLATTTSATTTKATTTLATTTKATTTNGTTTLGTTTKGTTTNGTTTVGTTTKATTTSATTTSATTTKATSTLGTSTNGTTTVGTTTKATTTSATTTSATTTKGTTTLGTSTNGTTTVGTTTKATTTSATTTKATTTLGTTTIAATTTKATTTLATTTSATTTKATTTLGTTTSATTTLGTTTMGTSTTKQSTTTTTLPFDG